MHEKEIKYEKKKNSQNVNHHDTVLLLYDIKICNASVILDFNVFLKAKTNEKYI